MSFAVPLTGPVIEGLFFGLHLDDFFLVGDDFFAGTHFLVFPLIGVCGKLEIPTLSPFVDAADFPLLSSIVSILHGPIGVT